MSAVLPENAFVAMVQVAQEKCSYLDRMQEWESRTGIAKYLNRPRDPFPKIQEYQLSELILDAFRGSFPDLCGYKGDKIRPDQFQLQPMVFYHRDKPLEFSFGVHMKDSRRFHQEVFEYRRGYGLVDSGYSTDGSPEMVARNRNSVVERREGGRRECGETMEQCFRKLDYFRDVVARGVDGLPKFSHRQLDGMIGDVERYRQQMAAAAKEDAERNRPIVDDVETFRGYIDARYAMAKIAYSVSRGTVDNSAHARERFNLLERRSDAYAKRECVPGVLTIGEVIAENKRESIRFGSDEARRLLETLYRSYEQSNGSSSEEGRRIWTIRRFSEVARDHGASFNDIVGFLKAGTAVFSDEDRRHVIEAVSWVDLDCVERLKEAVWMSHYRNDSSIISESFRPREQTARYLNQSNERAADGAMKQGNAVRKEPAATVKSRPQVHGKPKGIGF